MEMQNQKKVTISDLIKMKSESVKTAAVSCYDFITARLAQSAGIGFMIVGDSAAQAVLGHENTLPATMDFMVEITSGVRRGAPNAFLVADMPFLSYQASISEAIKNAGRFFTESNAQAVKIEASRAYINVIKAVSDADMAVMAHIGIRPQSICKKGKLKAEATTAEMAIDLILLAEEMIKAGASILLLEGTAAEVAKIITEKSPIPVVSCGSGPHCDIQVLTAPDILGLNTGFKPKFSKQFGHLAEHVQKAFSNYCECIEDESFPDDKHCYHMKTGELDRLQKLL